MVQFTNAQLAAWAGIAFWPLVRILALIGTAPVLSHRAIPVRAKVALGVAVAWVIAPTVPAPPLPPAIDAAFLEMLARNLLVGIALGFAVRIVFTGVELAGQMIGLQVGLSFGGFFNPEEADTDNPIGNFVSLLVLLIFVAIDGHLVLLQAVHHSFEIFPVAGADVRRLPFTGIANLGAEVFSIALTISLPILVVMLLINIVLGVMARVAPQMNLFAVGFPVTLSAGMIVLLLFVPYLEEPIRRTLERSVTLWPGG